MNWSCRMTLVGVTFLALGAIADASPAPTVTTRRLPAGGVQPAAAVDARAWST